MFCNNFGEEGSVVFANDSRNSNSNFCSATGSEIKYSVASV
jgi:hypothetical protein